MIAVIVRPRGGAAGRQEVQDALQHVAGGRLARVHPGADEHCLAPLEDVGPLALAPQTLEVIK